MVPPPVLELASLAAPCICRFTWIATTADPGGLLRDSLAKRAKTAGVDVTLEVWEDMIHVWQLFAPIT